MSDLIGQQVGRYQVLELLGEGGMATVYKAHDPRLERDVAIKVIRRDAFPPEDLDMLLKRFEREAKALGKLSHPNIVGVIDYGEHEGSPYLVMVYVGGGTLKDRLGYPLPPMKWRDAVRLLLPIARALEYVHERGIINRDVKPSNILMTEDGQPLLSDFGLAKLFEKDKESTSITGTGMGIGTPDYMAPEQGLGAATPQTDVYALGVMFFELVTGRRPYEADTPIAVLLKHTSDPLPRPRALAPDLPLEAEQVILRAMAKKPEDRYLTMSDLAAALERLAQVAGPAETGPRARPWLWVGVVGLAAVAGCVILAGGGWLALRGLGVGVLDATATTQPMAVATAPTPSALPPSTAAATEPPPPTLAPTLAATIPATEAPAGLPASDKDGMPQVFVPAGKFVMGPRNEVVEVAAFWIDQTEVTNAQYARCVAAGICEPPAGAGSQTRKFYFQNAEYDAYPVVFVAFDDAQTYCNWVGRRLPTGTEWEKAARGTDGWMYPWGDAAPDGTRANYGHQVGDSTPVGIHPDGASPFGVLDLAGNVAEWVDEEMDGGYRVSRGGSWTSEANAISAVVRYGVTPTRHFADYGFRCATRTAPAGVSEPPAAGTVTAAFAAGPNFSNFRACDRPCTEAGAQIVSVFPEKTTSIYVGWDYAGMQPEMPYTRIWSHGGVEWVRYYCLWRGPEQGTFSIRLWDNEGLRSGVWTLSISLDTVHDFTFNVPIEGVFDLFTPAGQLACPDFR